QGQADMGMNQRTRVEEVEGGLPFDKAGNEITPSHNALTIPTPPTPLLNSPRSAAVEDQQEALTGSNLDAPNSMLAAAAAAAADDDDDLTALTTKPPNLEITLGRQSWQKENAEASSEMRLKCL
ncbi:hypothetical protein BHM03_00059098, partial [Ensete ventricosum]